MRKSIQLNLPNSNVSFRIVLEYSDPSIYNTLIKHYKNYLTKNSPKSELQISTIKNSQIEKTYCSLNPKVSEKNKKLMVFHDGLFGGEIDFSSSHWRGIFICSPELSHVFTLIRLFGLLQLIYQGGIPLHASSVSLENKGYVFFGNQGDGKSTISRLSEGVIFSDDTALIIQKKNKYFIVATPFDFKFNNSMPGTVSLTACIKVQHQKKNNTLKKFQSGQIGNTLLEHTRPDVGFLVHSPTFMTKIFTSIVTFAELFDMFYTLDFNKSKQFIHNLENLTEGNS